VCSCALVSLSVLAPDTAVTCVNNGARSHASCSAVQQTATFKASECSYYCVQHITSLDTIPFSYQLPIYSLTFKFRLQFRIPLIPPLFHRILKFGYPIQYRAEERMKLWLRFPVIPDYVYGENVIFTLNFSSGEEQVASPFSMKTQII